MIAGLNGPSYPSWHRDLKITLDMDKASRPLKQIVKYKVWLKAEFSCSECFLRAVLIWRQLKCSVCLEIVFTNAWLLLQWCQRSHFTGQDYDVSSQYLSAHFYLASYFPLAPAVGQKHQNIPFLNGEILVSDTTRVAPLFTLQLLLCLPFW